MEQNLARDRRLFLKTGVATAMAAGLNHPMVAQEQASPASDSPGEKVVLGIMGVNGRGAAIAQGMMAASNVEVGAICDVDSRASLRVGQLVGEKQGRAPKVEGDFRRILDDNSIDVLVVSAPNHWHAPATILGCAAGKHVYVEKPCSHTPAEGEMAVAAARKHKRIVQMGTQRRSWSGIKEAIGKVLDGAIGEVHYSRTWYNNRRPSIGFGKAASIPEWLDWNLWQGPVPHREFKDNVLHYNWHWHWDWGNGELGNNGVHAIDVARWGLQVTYPVRVTSGGGKYRHDDDQETPDTMMVTMDFPGKKTITWEGLSWSPLGPHDSGFGISFHGTEGSLVIRGAGYTIYDMRGKELESATGDGGDTAHFADFLDAVRTGRLPNADIEIAHQSTLLCHLGNIAYRTNSILNLDPSDGHILENEAAQRLWTKEYEPGWEPQV